MNEPSNFDDGPDACKFGECPELNITSTYNVKLLLESNRNRDLVNVSQTEDKSFYNNIPWTPTKEKLYHKTLSMDGYS